MSLRYSKYAYNNLIKKGEKYLIKLRDTLSPSDPIRVRINNVIQEKRELKQIRDTHKRLRAKANMSLYHKD